jgi:hypothetical protein
MNDEEEEEEAESATEQSIEISSASHIYQDRPSFGHHVCDSLCLHP